MPSTETTPLRLEDNDGHATVGMLVTRVYDPAERARRAGLRLAGFWGAAVVSVFIPLAHFVLVPGFAIAGVVVAWMVWRQERAVDHAKGRCPACGEEVIIPLEANDTLPKWTYCPACKASVKLSAVD